MPERLKDMSPSPVPFAPVVYRLGQRAFTAQKRVRFPSGAPFSEFRNTHEGNAGSSPAVRHRRASSSG